jgi:hypothetical protein
VVCGEWGVGCRCVVWCVVWCGLCWCVGCVGVWGVLVCGVCGEWGVGCRCVVWCGVVWCRQEGGALERGRERYRGIEV